MGARGRLRTSPARIGLAATGAFLDDEKQLDPILVTRTGAPGPGLHIAEARAQ